MADQTVTLPVGTKQSDGKKFGGCKLELTLQMIVTLKLLGCVGKDKYI